MKTSLLAAFLLTASGIAQTYTLTNFGTQCGGDLNAQVVAAPTGFGLRLGVTGAAHHAIAVLVIGHPQPAPVPLPGSACLLLVDPRVTQVALTSAQGSAHFTFRIPPALPITFDNQAVILGITTTGIVATSTDGVRLHGV